METYPSKLTAAIWPETVFLTKGVLYNLGVSHSMTKRAEREKYFLGFSKKITTKVSKDEDVYKKGVLFKFIAHSLTTDRSNYFKFCLSESTTNEYVLAQAIEEVELIHMNYATYETEYLVSKVIYDETRAEEYKNLLLEKLDKILTKLNKTLDLEISDFSGIQKIEEFTNACMTFVVGLKIKIPIESIREYYETDNLEKRVNILSALLNTANYSKEVNDPKTTHTTTQAPTTASASPSGLIDVNKYKEKLKNIVNLTEENKTEILKKINYIETTKTDSSEKSSIVSYLDTLFSIPWDTFNETTNSISQIETDMEAKQFGLKTAKERVVEYLATCLNTKDFFKGPILCLVGSPGTGKTFFAKNIGTALNKKTVSIALGGVDDVTILKGQRRGWVGSEPGQIVKALIRSGTMNPLIVLDEIDKISGYKADSIKATLLEILDPNQNKEFKDDYLDLPIDISKITFVATANYLAHIPIALRDRLEIIEIEPYTSTEKFEIAQKFVIPKVLKEVNVNSEEVKISDEALHLIIESFKYDGGMRRIEQTVNKLIQKYIVLKMKNSLTETPFVITPQNIHDFVKLENTEEDAFDPNSSITGTINMLWVRQDAMGYIVGGGRSYVQIKTSAGTGKKQLTGSIQDTFKESIDVAFGFVRTNMEKLNIEPDYFKKHDFFIHAPDIAVKKSGPSAGMVIAVGLISAIKNLPISQKIGMTGEMDLSGNTLPIGGVKSKVMGSYSAGLRTFLIPVSNKKECEEEVDESVKSDSKIYYINNIWEALKIYFPDLILEE